MPGTYSAQPVVPHDGVGAASDQSARPAATCSTGPPAERFVFLDGLRGLAAFGVAAYHIWRYEPNPHPSVHMVPRLLDWVLLHAWAGVPVLLIVSGFVIAYKLRDTWVTPREVISFCGRRIVRLLPPFWVTVWLVVVMHAMCVDWWELPPPFEGSPSVGRVLAHMLFAQDVLGHTPLSAGLWTVCIEVQFYVVGVLCWGLAQHLRLQHLRQTPAASDKPLSPAGPRIVSGSDVRPSGWGLLLIFAPLGIVALFHWHQQVSTEAWVIHFLDFFFLGMVAWWILDRTISNRVFTAILVIMCGHLAIAWKLDNLIAIAGTVAIVVAGRTGHLGDWLHWRWLQYLGRISYSLYLVHYPVSHLITAVGWAWCDSSPAPESAALILVLSLAGSVAAAHLMYVFIELPSLRWASRIGRRSRTASVVAGERPLAPAV